MPSADESDLSACRFYVFGVVQGVILADGSVMTADRKFVEKNNTIICLPGAVSQNQMAAIVTSALKMTFAVFPGDKDLAAAGTVTAAMLQAQTSAARICDRRDPVLFRYRMACP